MNSEKNKKYYKKMIILYVCICALLIGLSFLSFLFSEWIMPVCTSICTVFGFLVLLLLIKSHSDITPESGKGSFMALMALRFICMGVGLVAGFLIVRFTMVEYNKLRYLMALASSLPYIVCFIPFLIIKQEE